MSTLKKNKDQYPFLIFSHGKGGYAKQNTVQFEELVSNGGRILNVVAMDSTLKGAISKAYKSVEKISFEKKYYRKDIGLKGLKYLTI